MSIQIDKALVQNYKGNIEIGLQQRGSKLESKVRNESQSAEFDYYDKIDATEAQEVHGRHGDTPLISTPHDRRRVGLRDFDWADLIDKKDKIRMLADPTASYTTNAVYALGRTKDSCIIEAMFGNAYTGKSGNTVVSWADQTDQVVAVDLGGSAEGLTIGKLIETKKILLKAEVDLDFDELHFAYTAEQLGNLLATTQVTSADYNSVKALVEGKVDTFMGFKFTNIEMLPTDSSGYRRCAAWVKSGVLLAKGEDITVDVGPRRDKRNSVQVYAAGSWNATRMDEKKVVEVLCSEA